MYKVDASWLKCSQMKCFLKCPVSPNSNNDNSNSNMIVAVIIVVLIIGVTIVVVIEIVIVIGCGLMGSTLIGVTAKILF